MKSFRQFLLEISVGQREQHSTGEYEWKGAQWIKQNKKGLKPAAKKDIGAELTKQAEARDKAQQKQQKATTKQNQHVIDVHYNKPGSNDRYQERVDIMSGYGDDEKGHTETTAAAKNHFEKQGYNVHKVEHKGIHTEKEAKQQHKEPIGPKQLVKGQQYQEPAGPPKQQAGQQHANPIGPQKAEKGQQHANPIGPEQPPKEQQHQKPIGPSKPDTNQQHQKPIGPSKPDTNQQHKKPIGPEKPTEAGVGKDRQDYKVHVWDKRRDKKGSGIRSVKQPNTAVGKAADFLITGQTSAFDDDYLKTPRSSWLQDLKDKHANKKEEEEKNKKTANTASTTNEVFELTRKASTWLHDLSESIKKSER